MRVSAVSAILDKREDMSQDNEGFTPIQPNPFLTGVPVPVSRPDMFFGREDDFAYVSQRLLAEDEGMVLLLVGARRSGKTSIMYQILNGKLGPEFLPVFIDMQLMAGVDEDRDFLGRLARYTVEGVGDKRLNLDYYDFSSGNPILVFDQLLDDIQRLYPDKRLLFLVDEAERLPEKVVAGELGGGVLSYMASILENRRMSFCFTGSPGMGVIEEEEWRRLTAKGTAHKIGFLSPGDTRLLIERPVAGRMSYAEGVVEGIYQLTFGHPFYTQVICSHLVDYLNQMQRNQVTEEDLDEVVRIIIGNAPPHLTYQWDELDETEQLALSLISEEIDQVGQGRTPQELVVAIDDNDYPLDLKADVLHVALESLHTNTNEWLLRNDDGSYQFGVDFYRLWVRRARSIWLLVGEAEKNKSRKPLWMGLGAAAVLAVAAWAAFWPSPESGEGQGVDPSPPISPSTGDVWVEADLNGAEIWLDGQRLEEKTGPVPIKLTLASGAHVVELRHPQYHVLAETMQVVAGHSQRHPVSMRRRTGFLAVESPVEGVQVRVQGERDTVLSGPFAALELPTGAYTVQATRAGYVAESRDLVLEDGATALVDFALRARVGELYLISQPTGASVQVDGAHRGQTPLHLEKMPVGRHQVRLRKADYQARDTTLTVVLGRADTVRLGLQLQPARLQIKSEPPGAVVWVDGSQRGSTPIAVDVEPGAHRLRLVLEGYDAREVARDFGPGERYQPPAFQLVRQYGQVRIVKPYSGRLLLNGANEKRFPPADIRLPVGWNTLALQGSAVESVYVYKDSTVKVRLK
ncbi:MAG: PEGA domain-containing protein [Candidatus Latescibacteria bacterium]|nr:PEGA domain-containing protein [Candidatus Latescibacterota bacterium]